MLPADVAVHKGEGLFPRIDVAKELAALEASKEKAVEKAPKGEKKSVPAKKEQMRARLILQVHDELLVEAPEEEITLATIILKEEMEHAIQLKVPLEADTNVGDNWLAAK